MAVVIVAGWLGLLPHKVIAISQTIPNIVDNLKTWTASSPLVVESGLKIVIPSWSRPTISVPDASSQPAVMHATVLVTRDPGNDNLFLSNGSSTIATLGMFDTPRRTSSTAASAVGQENGVARALMA